MTTLFALAAAVSWGSSDFVAGIASRRASELSVVVTAHLTGLVALLAIVPALTGGGPGVAALGWGAAAGACGGVGAALLYRGLAIGRMGVVAPVTAAGAAVLPTVAGLFLGHGLGPMALAGIALALPAIVLVALPAPHVGAFAAPPLPDGTTQGGRGLRHWLRQPGLPEALLSGIGFGGFYLFLERAPADAGLWPLLGARIASLVFR